MYFAPWHYIQISVQFHAPTENIPRHPMVRRLEEPQSQSGLGGEQKNARIFRKHYGLTIQIYNHIIGLGVKTDNGVLIFVCWQH